MRLVARFMKPYWALCAVTTVLLLVDVVGALVIPTFAAELLNESATSASFKKMTITAVGMGVAAQGAVNQPVAVLHVKGQTLDQGLLFVAGGDQVKAVLVFCVQHDKLRVGVEGPQSDRLT